MGFVCTSQGVNAFLRELRRTMRVVAPVRFAGGGAFTGTDCVRYAEISDIADVVFDEKSRFSFKELLLPPSQTLFYFTEDHVTEPAPDERGVVIFLRSCDLHAVRRLDEIYRGGGNPDYYYEQRRKGVRFVLMGCRESFDSCFCVDMGTNVSENYDLSIEPDGALWRIDCKDAAWAELLCAQGGEETPVTPAHVTETKTRVHILDKLDFSVAKSRMWDEYDKRCIACGRCNFSCPTCTCFSMQDIFYQDNPKTGERRRVQASCMVDGFADMAGGSTYRKNHGARMRYKVLHKVYDFHKRSGFQMCVGCGRCDDVCPEYISFSHIVNRLGDAMKEVSGNAE